MTYDKKSTNKATINPLSFQKKNWASEPCWNQKKEGKRSQYKSKINLINFFLFDKAGIKWSELPIRHACNKSHRKNYYYFHRNLLTFLLFNNTFIYILSSFHHILLLFAAIQGIYLFQFILKIFIKMIIFAFYLCVFICLWF